MEACDNNAETELISVEFAQGDAPHNNFIVLRGDELNSSFKNVTFYTKFFDAESLDYCFDECLEGMGECPDYVLGCYLDEGTPNPMVSQDLTYIEKCPDIDYSESGEYYTW